MKDAFGNLQNGSIFKSDFYRKLNNFNLRIEIHASGSLDRGTWLKPLLLFQNYVARHNWFALFERPVSDAHAPFVLPEYLKMVLSKNGMRNVAWLRIRGHGLKCETGLYGRNPDRSARVCNLCENGDYILQDEKHVTFSCMGTEHSRHQFNHLFDNVSEGDIIGFVFQHNPGLQIH